MGIELSKLTLINRIQTLALLFEKKQPLWPSSQGISISVLKIAGSNPAKGNQINNALGFLFHLTN